MKTIGRFAAFPAVLLFAFALFAQVPATPTPPAAPATGDIFGVALNYGPNDSPRLHGLAFYAHDVNTGQSLRTFAVAELIENSITRKPFGVQTSTLVGFAQELFRSKDNRFSLFTPVTVGAAVSGNTNLGLAIGTGARATYALGPKFKDVNLLVGYQFTHTTIGGTQAKDFIFGFAKDFGKVLP